MAQNDYRLKTGRQIYINALAKFIIGNENTPCSNDEAEAALKQNPNAIALFDSYPANWEQRIGISKAKASKKAAAPAAPKAAKAPKEKAPKAPKAPAPAKAGSGKSATLEPTAPAGGKKASGKKSGGK